MVVLIDLLIMFIFILFLWIVTYLVKIDAERHKKLLFETSEFSITIRNFPKLSNDYHIIQLKAELWNHIETIIKEQPH